MILYQQNYLSKCALLSIRLLLFILSIQLLQGCYFFRKKGAGNSLDNNESAVLGTPLGQKAGGPDYEALEEIYGITTPYAPAAVRPDPDTFIRQLLLQYRNEGPTVAREIGRVEAFRILLGGANEDFSKNPQDRYDATSLLANMKVAEEICRALVAPTAIDHPGWESILPNAPSEIDMNIKFLAQRFIGVRNRDLDDAKLDSLREIFDLANETGSINANSYIPVCTTLAIDAEGLLL